MTQMIPCLLTWEEDSHLFPTLSWHGGWSNWWDLQLNISDPSKKTYFVLKNLVLDRIDVWVSHLNTGNLVWGGSYFFANRVGRYIPRKLKGGGIFHGSPKIPKIGKRETIKKNTQFGVFQTLPPPKFKHSPLKNGGWKTIPFLLGFGNFFRGQQINFGGCVSLFPL